MKRYLWIWVFNDGISTIPRAIFNKKRDAIDWICENRLTGVLTKYPLDISIYDWTIQNGYFTPKNDYQKNAKTIANFNSAYLKHYHFKDGK